MCINMACFSSLPFMENPGDADRTFSAVIGDNLFDVFHLRYPTSLFLKYRRLQIDGS